MWPWMPRIADLTDSLRDKLAWEWQVSDRWESKGQLGGRGASQVCPRPLPLISRTHPALPPPWQGWRLTYCPWLSSDRRMKSLRWRYTRLVRGPAGAGAGGRSGKAGEVRSLAGWDMGQGAYSWVSPFRGPPELTQGSKQGFRNLGP